MPQRHLIYVDSHQREANAKHYETIYKKNLSELVGRVTTLPHDGVVGRISHDRPSYCFGTFFCLNVIEQTSAQATPAGQSHWLPLVPHTVHIRSVVDIRSTFLSPNDTQRAML